MFDEASRRAWREPNGSGSPTRFFQMPLVFLPVNYVNRAVDVGVVDGLIPKLHKALRCYYAFEDGGWRSIEATTNHKNPDSENPSGRPGHECPSFALTVSGSAVDACALDAQVGDARDSRTQWHETAVRRRVQKVPTFRLTSHQGYGTDITDQLQGQPRTDPLDVCQNGQDRRLDVAIGAKAFCVVTHERRGLPET